MATTSRVDYEYDGPMYFDLTTSTTVCTDFLPDSMKGAEASGQEVATVEEVKVEIATEQQEAPWVFNAPTWSDFSHATPSREPQATQQPAANQDKSADDSGGKNLGNGCQANRIAYTTPIKAAAGSSRNRASSTPLSAEQQKRYEKTGITKPSPVKPIPAATTTRTMATAVPKSTATTNARKPAVINSGGRANAPSQHPSYLHSTAASRKAGTTPKVDKMASFLRPTAASWIRNQKDKEAAAQALTAKPGIRRPSTSSTSTPTSARAKPTRTTPLSARGLPRNKLTETTEEREIREAEEARKQLHKLVKANQAAHEKNKYMGATATAVPRSTKPLTIPISPAFHERHGRQTPEVHSPEPPAAPVHQVSKPSGPTIPHSPHLATDARAARKGLITKAPAAASQKPAQHEGSKDSHRFGWQGPKPLTVPKTPNLQTKQRAALRPSTGHEVSSREKEEDEALHHQFKALPLDTRILHSRGEMGVPKVTPHGVTETKPFNFQTDNRKRMSNTKNNPPPSPPKTKRVVDPSNFELSTERRGRIHEMAFQQKLAMEFEEAARQRQVHARPMPNLDRAFVPQPAAKELTEFEEFPLRSMGRHEHAQAQFAEKVRREREEERKQAEIRALPLPVSTFQRTFEVKPVDREPLIPMSMNLNTMVRAEERRMFEEEIMSRQAFAEAAAKTEKAMAKQKEEEEMREYRSLPVEQGGCQFVAKPIHHPVQPLAPAPSNKKLTVPKTPNLLTSKRSHNRIQYHHE